MNRALAAGLGIIVIATSAPAFADVSSCLHSAERAQPLRRAGELRRARAELITCSASTCPGAVRADCTRWLTELDSALPSVVIQARDASGTDITDVTVSIDGAVQQKGLDGLAISVDPGTRLFRFDAPGRDPVEQTLAIRESEKGRVVPVVLIRPGEAKRSVSPPLAKVEQVERPPGGRGVPAASWILGGAGLLVASSGVVLWGWGVTDRDDLRGQCASAASCAQSDITAAKTKLVVGDVLVGAGLVAIATGVWLALRSGPPISMRAGSPAPHLLAF